MGRKPAREAARCRFCHEPELVDDLLDVSRITRGKLQLRKCRVELAEVVRNAIEALSLGRGDPAASPVDKYLGCATPQCESKSTLASPIAHLDAKDPPTLLIHGELDKIVSVGQSRAFDAAARAKGVASELVVIPFDAEFAARSAEDFIERYFSTVPEDTDTGWSMLGPEGRSVGRDSYESWWSSVADVQVSDIDPADSGETADVTLTYSMKDGRVETERQRLDLLRSGDRWLINGDENI